MMPDADTAVIRATDLSKCIRFDFVDFVAAAVTVAVDAAVAKRLSAGADDDSSDVFAT